MVAGDGVNHEVKSAFKCQLIGRSGICMNHRRLFWVYNGLFAVMMSN